MENIGRSIAGDRQQVALGETWEMGYLIRKFRVSETMIRRAISAVGDSRTKVEQYIRRQQMKPGIGAQA